MLPIDASTKAVAVQDSYLNQNSLNSIKAMGREKDPQALREVAKKFEAMFVQQMLKTMREANEVFAEGGYLNSEESRFHRDMMDQQTVLNLTSGAGIGLASQFYQQMSQAYLSVGESKTAGLSNAIINHQTVAAADGLLHNPVTRSSVLDHPRSIANSSMNAWMDTYLSRNVSAPTPAELQSTLDGDPSIPAVPFAIAKPTTSIPGVKAGIADSPENFVALLKPHAEKAAAELNINPDVLIAQVALETGWGKHVIHGKNGENSFNLFNIKTGSSWQGDKVKVATLEYRGGIAASEKSDFRKYANYAESFSDYVKLVKHNPRYQDALQSGSNSSAYAEALQTAGYATDPQYAKKIKNLLNTDVIRDLGTKATTILSLATAVGQIIPE